MNMREHEYKKRTFAAMLCALLFLNCVPSYAYAADAENWASLEGWLADINGILEWIYYDVEDILYTYMEPVSDSLVDGNDSVISVLKDIKLYLSSPLYGVGTPIWGTYNELQDVNTTLENIYEQFNDGTLIGMSQNLGLNVKAIKDALQSMTSSSVSPWTESRIQTLLDDLQNLIAYQDDIVSYQDETNDILSSVRLDNGVTNGLLTSILAKMVIDEVQEDLIGDFDWPAYSSNIGSLVSVASGKFPFSSVMGLRTFVMGNPLFSGDGDDYDIQLPWQFGTNSSYLFVSLDSQFLVQAQPYIRFFVYILFVYGLLLTTYKMVRES